jgi:hypothetical protein
VPLFFKASGDALNLMADLDRPHPGYLCRSRGLWVPGARHQHQRGVAGSWADEDVYLPVAEEIRLLERASFGVDVLRRGGACAAAPPFPVLK